MLKCRRGVPVDLKALSEVLGLAIEEKLAIRRDDFLKTKHARIILAAVMPMIVCSPVSSIERNFFNTKA